MYKHFCDACRSENTGLNAQRVVYPVCPLPGITASIRIEVEFEDVDGFGNVHERCLLNMLAKVVTQERRTLKVKNVAGRSHKTRRSKPRRALR